MEMYYFFRKPKYPVIVDIDGNVIAGLSELDLINEIEKIEAFKKDNYDIVDFTGEVWIFIPKQSFMSPLSFKKNRTKKDLINLINNRNNKPANERLYSDRSISAKRYEIIFKELIKILKS